MSRNKKISLGVIIFLVTLVAYIWLAHHLIYRKIGQGNLPLVDLTHDYYFDDMNTENKLVYAALGDSLTAGAGTERYEDSFPYQLASKFFDISTRDINLQVFAYPGARTENLINDLLQPAIAAQPNLVTLFIGVNDVHGLISAGHFKKNYEYIIQQLQEKTHAKIFLINIPYIGSDSLIREPWRFYLDKETAKFNEIIQDLAKQYQLDYIDLATPTHEKLRQDGEHYSVDTFHPSAAGYAWWAEIVYDQINR